MTIKITLELTRPPNFELDVDIELPNSGVTAIYGASGSGKTTILRCIAGLERTDKAKITFNEHCWQDECRFVPAHRRSIGYVFQESSLLPHLNAADNIHYAIKRRNKLIKAGKYEKLVDQLGIKHCLSRMPNQLSGGERQRVAIARAILIEPDILLMDEPLASLDQARKDEILSLLETLSSQLKTPAIYVSHSIAEITRLAHHVVVLEQGKVTAQGQLNSIFPSLFNANTENDPSCIIEGKVERIEENWGLSRIQVDSCELWVSSGNEKVGETVRLQIYAKDISISLSPKNDSTILNKIPVKVIDIVENDGKAMNMLRLQANNTYLLARITAKSRAQLNIEVGTMAWAQIKSTAIIR